MFETVTAELPVFYTVCFRKYDSLTAFHGQLYRVRQEYFQTEQRCREKVKDLNSGIEISCRYSISEKGFKWLKKCGHQVLEQALQQSGGYCILSWDEMGNLLSKKCFSKEHQWLKSAYFKENDSSQPMAVLTPLADCNGILLKEYDCENQTYITKKLFAFPYEMGTAVQSYCNSVAGEPELLCATNMGDFCYCEQEEFALRKEATENLKDGEISLEPEWHKQEESLADLFSFQSGEEESEKCEQGETERQEEKSDVSASHELVQLHTEQKVQPLKFAVNHDLVAFPPRRYTVAVKNMSGKVIHARDLIHEKGQKKKSVVPELWPVINNISEGKRVVISAQESYFYFGELMNGLRQGKGRTQKPDGSTAYEGEYSGDKRNGFGTYYYKSGKLCYAGEWKENKRNGAGVSFRSSDSSVYVGRWKDDKPVGTGSVFDKDGNLCYAGRFENGQRQGAGISYNAEQGSVFVGKWKSNEPTGVGAAFDSEGNLIYTGMWKDGKRHGRGTEFAPDGRIVFTGEWRNDVYYDGVLYTQIQQEQEE